MAPPSEPLICFADPGAVAARTGVTGAESLSLSIGVSMGVSNDAAAAWVGLSPAVPSWRMICRGERPFQEGTVPSWARPARSAACDAKFT
eukprot:CAMPEP_0179490730 /NCGR_PEP_ID=MMETSP0799-20121207/65640_1 /TAXON_ID=46947 /ORGANISM="Geminigera cryophila, Strain CCMP2564" /LENGTH=89 /DNA_ID=CAMNT_0021306993 /DNA_START=18 /DNA_END=287 /DNA_ORIENTATION=-